MPERPPGRERLAALMEQRRLDLNLTWEQVADAGGASYESLRAARNGSAGISRLTRAAIERGLRWTPGSVDQILDGADPVPLDGVSGSRAATVRAAVPELPGNEALLARVLAADPEDQEVLRQIMRIPDEARRQELIEAWFAGTANLEAAPTALRDHGKTG